MKLTHIIGSIAAVLVLSACSGSDSAEKTAIAMCEFAKKADIKGMKSLSTPEFAKQFEQIEVLFDAAVATDLGKAELEKQIDSMSGINCKESTKITEIDDKTKSVKNAETAQEFKVVLIDGSWKVSQ